MMTINFVRKGLQKSQISPVPSRLIIFFSVFCLINSNIIAQLNTYNNYTGSWSDASSWETAQPSPLTVDVNDDILVYGKITRSGDLSIATSGANAVTVKDTLIVDGDLTFNSGFTQFFVDPGGFLIVLGDFNTMGSLVSISGGGVLIVSGNLTLDGGSVYSGPSSDLYVDGTSTETNQDFDQLEIDYPDLHGEYFGSLPVVLTSFKAHYNHGQTDLHWTTASEENFSFFSIERSSNGSFYQRIGKVHGTGSLTDGNHYSFTDNNPQDLISYYRLTAIDLDGSQETFYPISIKNKIENEALVIYPLPSQSGTINIKLANGRRLNDAKLMIYDVFGHLIINELIHSNTGEFQLDESLGSGFYHTEVHLKDKILKQKIIVQ